MRRTCSSIVLTGACLLLSAGTALPAYAAPLPQVSKTKAAPPSADALIANARRDLEAGRFAEALKRGNVLTGTYPGRWEGHRIVALAAIGLDQPDRAEKAYRQALRLAPPAQKSSLQNGLAEVGALRQALRDVARARELKAAGQTGAAARAMESAYDILPSRTTYGLNASEWYETAGRLDEARRILEDVKVRKLSPQDSALVAKRLDAVMRGLAAKRQADQEDAVRKQEADRQAGEARRAEAERQAAERERQRIETERRAEAERQKAERERSIREETDRLNSRLNEQRDSVSQMESAVRSADSAVSDAQRQVDEADRQANDARSRSDRAKDERDDWQGKVDGAKRDIDKDIYRDKLRQAQSRYDDAKGDYDRAQSRLNDAKSRLSQAQSDASDARRKLDQANQDVRDTEAALSRLANGG